MQVTAPGRDQLRRLAELRLDRPVVLSLYLYLVFQALTFAKHARDRGGTFLIICLIMFFVFQKRLVEGIKFTGLKG